MMTLFTKLTHAIRKRILSFILVASGFLISGCATTDQPVQEPFHNTYWKLIELQGKPVSTLPNQAREAYLQFRAEDKLKGHTGCNALFGSYQALENTLTFQHIGSTRMSCFNETGDNEIALMQLLSTPKTWRIEGTHLIFMDDQARIVARFKSVYF